MIQNYFVSKFPKLGITGFFMFVGIFPIAAQQVVGINAAIRDQVQTRKFDKDRLEKVRLKGRVNMGDYIQTGTSGVLQILLRDRTSLTIGKNGRLTIDRFVYDPATNASEVTATVTKGAFRFISGKAMRNRKGRSQIRTPVGSIGIRGTIFEGAVGTEAIALAQKTDLPDSVLQSANEEATFVVLRGPGASTQGDEEAGAVDFVTDSGIFPLERSGDAYFVPRKNARPFGPFRFGSNGFYWAQGWNFAGRAPAQRTRPDNGRNQQGSRNRRGGRGRNGGPPQIGGNFEIGDAGGIGANNVNGVP